MTAELKILISYSGYSTPSFGYKGVEIELLNFQKKPPKNKTNRFSAQSFPVIQIKHSSHCPEICLISLLRGSTSKEDKLDTTSHAVL